MVDLQHMGGCLNSNKILTTLQQMERDNVPDEDDFAGGQYFACSKLAEFFQLFFSYS